MFELLPERLTTSVLSSSIDGKSDEGGAGAESPEALREKLRGLEEQLATSRSELEELKEQMRLGVLSVECGEGDPAAAGAGAARGAPNQAAQQLSARVAELEEELAGRPAEAGGRSSRDGVTIKQLTEKVEELRAALSRRESTKGGGEKDGEGEKTVKALRERVAELEAALAAGGTSGKDGGRGGGGAAGDGDQVHRLQERVGELEGELRKRVPRSELEEVQVSLGLQCEQLARERADVARRLNNALLELERLRPPPRADDGEEEEEEEELSESSEPSGISGNTF